jgi:hypothetical protein
VEFRETGCVVVDCIYPVWNRVEGSCEHGNECLGSIKRKEFLHQPSDCWIVKKGLAVHS